MRKLLNTNDEKLRQWIQKSIDTGKRECEFLYSANNTILNDIYKARLNKLPAVKHETDTQLELETGSICISSAIVEKDRHSSAIESATKALENNQIVYEVMFICIPQLKTYVMINDANERRNYDIFGLQSVYYTENPQKFVELLGLSK